MGAWRRERRPVFKLLTVPALLGASMLVISIIIAPGIDILPRFGLVVGAHRVGRPLVLGSYPITPASDVLHALSGLKRFGVTTLQAEDEIAGIGAALGAAFGGAVGVTTTSGPGIALKGEAMGLAIMTELPLVIVNSQRGGPSTGLPTKTEQSDLYQAVYGRNGDAPMPVISARSPGDAFDCAIEACRIATEYMTPVMLLTDGYIANAAEPWAMLDMTRIGQRNVPPVLAINCKSTGKNVWCIPVTTSGAYNAPYKKPPIAGTLSKIFGKDIA